MKQPSVQTVALLRSPIVTVLGHVDHGKTTLLDTIRSTAITAKEHGGITQHIGAYEVSIPEGLSKKLNSAVPSITFIDTPGHQAFAKMRSRGATVADIAILVVAANDGVQPQTVESIQHIQAAHIPLIVALNKIDLPDIGIEKIKKQLTKLDLKLEEYGGETPVVPLSAKTGKGIDKLLEMILVLSELHNVKQDSSGLLQAVVIESVLSKNRGPVATVVVRSGTIRISDELYSDTIRCRVRAITNWKGISLASLSAGQAAEIQGWQSVPSVGSIVTPTQSASSTTHAPKVSTVSTAPAPEPAEEKMRIILRSDTAGTLEAIIAGLSKDMIEIISNGVGNISESDILFAKTAKAIVVGFGIKPTDSVIKLATAEKVLIKTYRIIYELFDELSEVVTALRQGNLITVLGEAKIIAVFPMKDQVIAGVKVISGRIARGDQIKIVRENQEIGRARIKSLRHLKEDITKAEQGKEAGVILSQKIDFLTGDAIIAIG